MSQEELIRLHQVERDSKSRRNKDLEKNLLKMSLHSFQRSVNVFARRTWRSNWLPSLVKRRHLQKLTPRKLQLREHQLLLTKLLKRNKTRESFLSLRIISTLSLSLS
jgi:hypothetical protein